VGLLHRCLRGGETALLDELVRRLHPRILGSVRAAVYRIGRPVPGIGIEDHVQDVYQHLFERDCLRLRSFRGSSTGKLMAYLDLVSVNRVRDTVRDAHSQKRYAPTRSLDQPGPGPRPTPLSERLADPRDLERTQLLRDQLDKLVRQLRRLARGRHGDRDVAIFMHRYRDGLSAHEIASLPWVSVSAAGVDSITSRLMRKLQRASVGDFA
jgi:RNA polymerase sigma factor (sigma-70 family)